MDRSTRYLGLALGNPLIASSSPLTSTVERMQALEAAGVAAVVMPSLFEEQVVAEDSAYALYTEHGSNSQAEAAGYFPALPRYDRGVSGHLDTVRRAVDALRIPVIASLNAVTLDGWIGFAQHLEQAGAAALELNMYAVPAAAGESGQDVEARYVDVVGRVKRAVGIPVAVKLSPYFSSTGHLAHQLADAGADGLVLFNRFYQPDFDLDTLAVRSELKLSSRHEAGPPLLWIALLSGRVRASLAATSGVETFEELVKYLLAGADAVMSASALLRHGPRHARTLLDGLEGWLDANGHRSVAGIHGSKRALHAEASGEMLRAQYVRVLSDYLPGRLVG